MQGFLMSYGQHGLTNFGSKTPRPQSVLKLETYDVKARKLSHVVAATRKNLWTTQLSIWRMVSASILPEYPVSIFKTVPKRTHFLYIDDLFPNYYRDAKVWSVHHEKIIDAVASEITNLGRSIRSASIVFVLSLRPGQPITNETVDMLAKFWKLMGFPTSAKSSTRFRYYLPSSCLVSSKLSERSAHIKTLPRTAGRMFTLYPDDMSFNSAVLLADRHGMRVTFNAKKHRTKNATRIQPGSDEWTEYTRLSRDNDGSSAMYPVIFTTDTLTVDFEKVVRFYGRFTDIIFLSEDN